MDDSDDNNSKSTGSNDKAGSKDTAEQKWCSVLKTTTHNDVKCYAQGAPRPS